MLEQHVGSGGGGGVVGLVSNHVTWSVLSKIGPLPTVVQYVDEAR